MAGGIPALALVDASLVACLSKAQAQIDTTHDSDPLKVLSPQQGTRGRTAGRLRTRRLMADGSVMVKPAQPPRLERLYEAE
jgi:hypothetical protein